jgi:hypothetical protein
MRTRARILQVRVRDRGDAVRHRRGEQRDLARVRRAAEDGVDVLGEAHVEHLVRFVEHDGLQRFEVQRALPQVVERTTRRRDDDVRAALQAHHLATEVLAAVDRQHDAARAAAVAMEGLRDLVRELARRHEREDQRTVRRGAALGQTREQRQRERRGLAGAGGGLREDVAAGEDQRDRFPLDLRRFFVTERGERSEEVGRQPEVGERGGHSVVYARDFGRASRGRGTEAGRPAPWCRDSSRDGIRAMEGLTRGRHGT